MFFMNYITSSKGIILSIRREAPSSQNLSPKKLIAVTGLSSPPRSVP